MVDLMSRRRMEENEAVFREKNEEVAQGLQKLKSLAKREGEAVHLGDLDTELLFYCECSDEDCRERIELKPSIYSKIHIKRDIFIVLPDHEVITIEQVVKKENNYHVVKKHRTPTENPDGLQCTAIDNS